MAMELSASFDCLMNKSPISEVDLSSFLRSMRRCPSGTLVTSKLLAARIQSPSEAQAIQAFDVLEAALSSETEGSIEFRTEIGRYRFLNEIIRILSPKYMGDKTLPGVKERAIRFLNDAAGPKRKMWFPSEHSKITAVYDSLVDGGVIKKSQKFPSTEADEEAELQKSIFDRTENALVLKTLLQSKDPSDLQAANRLIKNLVEEESKRIERRGELHSLIDRIETSTSLLSEMLSQVRIDKEIVDELAENCRTLRQKLGGIATETNDETTSLLQASENLEQVLDLYEKKKNSKEEDKDQEDVEVEGTLQEIGAEAIGMAITIPVPPTLSLVDELLLKLDLGMTSDDNHKGSSTSFEASGDNLLNFDIDLSPQTPVSIHETKPFNPLDEIERLSRELMEQSLLGVSGPISNNFSAPEFKKSTDKSQTLSQMQKSSIEINSQSTSSSTKENRNSSDDSSLLDFGILDKSSSTTMLPSAHENNFLLDLSDQPIKLSPSNLISESNTTVTKSPTVSVDPDIIAVRKLLNSIKELDLDKVDLIDTINPLDLCLGPNLNINLTLTFGMVLEYHPCIKVGIIAFTNKNSTSGIYNYVFQLMPPKGLQVKLLPPTTMELPAWRKSFLPPPVLTQVALILFPKDFHPPSHPTKIKFILSYSTDDDDTALHNGDFELPSSLMNFKMPI